MRLLLGGIASLLSTLGCVAPCAAGCPRAAGVAVAERHLQGAGAGPAGLEQHQHQPQPVGGSAACQRQQQAQAALAGAGYRG